MRFLDRGIWFLGYLKSLVKVHGRLVSGLIPSSIPEWVVLEERHTGPRKKHLTAKTVRNKREQTSKPQAGNAI